MRCSFSLLSFRQSRSASNPSRSLFQPLSFRLFSSVPSAHSFPTVARWLIRSAKVAAACFLPYTLVLLLLIVRNPGPLLASSP
jgi:hypothetical protein